MLDKLNTLFLYGGLSSAEYGSILPNIQKQNQQDLKSYCGVIIPLLGCSAVAVLATSTFNISTAVVYGLGFAFLLVLFLLAGHAGPLEKYLKYVFVGGIYAFGILVTLAQPDSLAVLYMVILVLVPLLFSGRPIVNIAFTIGAVIVFCIFEMAFKDSRLVTVDIWNAVTYGLLSIFIGIVTQTVRLENLIQLSKIAMLSESDVLTGLKNRNCFEQNLLAYKSIQNKDITCIYADVNGLHEVNNSQGHKAGDLMLQTVADVILKHYGREHSYRIGGDEFVVFAFGQTAEETQKQITEMNRQCIEKGYYVSIGFACSLDTEEKLDNLIKKAEEKMYIAKTDYYSTIGHDRRKRQ